MSPTVKSMRKKSATCIIAEAGVNHNGSYDMALHLIDAAAKAGADIVKFQTFTASSLVNKHAQQASYQQQNTGVSETQLEMLKKLELPQKWHAGLMEHCKQQNITFLSTPFDFLSIDFLASLAMRTWKIPSGEITNLPYLRKIGAMGARGDDIILSTGMCTLEEVHDAVRVLEQSGSPLKNISILHCTTEYPAPYGEINLRAMQTLKEAFPHCKGVGYSDHSQGIEIPLAAVAMGATIIEKHFTLDRNLEGPDHKASLEPHELAAMVQGIRHIEHALGDGVKMPTASEKPNKIVARKSIVAAKPIKAGEVFTEDNLTVKRPGDGISPMLWDEVVGAYAEKEYSIDAQITSYVRQR